MKRVCVMGREKKNEREKKRERNIILMGNLIELFLFFLFYLLIIVHNYRWLCTVDEKLNFLSLTPPL